MIGRLPNGKLVINQNQLAEIIKIKSSTLIAAKKRYNFPCYSDGYNIYYIVDEIKDIVKEKWGVDLEKEVERLIKERFNW